MGNALDLGPEPKPPSTPSEIANEYKRLVDEARGTNGNGATFIRASQSNPGLLQFEYCSRDDGDARTDFGNIPDMGWYTSCDGGRMRLEEAIVTTRRRVTFTGYAFNSPTMRETPALHVMVGGMPSMHLRWDARHPGSKT